MVCFSFALVLIVMRGQDSWFFVSILIGFSLISVIIGIHALFVLSLLSSVFFFLFLLRIGLFCAIGNSHMFLLFKKSMYDKVNFKIRY